MPRIFVLQLEPELGALRTILDLQREQLAGGVPGTGGRFCELSQEVVQLVHRQWLVASAQYLYFGGPRWMEVAE